MRILSQDGMIDVPYEMVALHECDGKIRMNIAGDTGKGTVLAEYSAKAKAKRAMEMLQEKYTGKSDGFKNENGTLYREKHTYECMYFQFPADDELES